MKATNKKTSKEQFRFDTEDNFKLILSRTFNQLNYLLKKAPANSRLIAPHLNPRSTVFLLPSVPVNTPDGRFDRAFAVKASCTKAAIQKLIDNATLENLIVIHVKRGKTMVPVLSMGNGSVSGLELHLVII